MMLEVKKIPRLWKKLFNKDLFKDLNWIEFGMVGLGWFGLSYVRLSWLRVLNKFKGHN